MIYISINANPCSLFCLPSGIFIFSKFRKYLKNPTFIKTAYTKTMTKLLKSTTKLRLNPAKRY